MPLQHMLHTPCQRARLADDSTGVLHIIWGGGATPNREGPERCECEGRRGGSSYEGGRGMGRRNGRRMGRREGWRGRKGEEGGVRRREG